ncbi:MAG TPA: Sec-independent protein translocase protein TatB [Mycobacteriales bacterium]
MFNNLGWAELAVLFVLGMLIFGPERLPKAAADAGRLVRELRRMASGVSNDLRDELGVDVEEIRRLDPRRFFDEDPEPVAPAAAALPAGERPPYDPDAT